MIDKIARPAEASARRGYHHGDLRAALLQTGMQLLEDDKGEGVSLRQVARQIGVTVGAVYRHFPDKAALLQALAGEGLAQLGKAQSEAMASEGTGQAAFNASGRAYVRFALKRPALFRLIMSCAPPVNHFADDLTAVTGPMRLLRETVKNLAPDASAEDLRIAALRSWSIVHGLAMLMLDGQTPADDALIDRVIDSQTFL